MALAVKKITTWDKGVVTAIGDKSIPAGTASRSHNFFSRGDRTELVPGQQLVGDNNATDGVTYGMITAIAIDGSEQTFKKISTKIQWYDADTNTWQDVVTGLTDEDMTFSTYRTPAGSFVFITSPNNGLYRINVANPTTAHDFFNSSINFKGYTSISENRMRMWRVIGAETIIRHGKIDGDFPYNSVTNENAASGDGVTLTFTGSLAQDFITTRSLSFTDTTETFTDTGGMGDLVGSLGGTGSINYTTGAYSITFNTAPVVGVNNIKASYQNEDPNDGGITDFRFTSPVRLAGEGDFFFQGDDSDGISTVAHFEGVEYVAHKRLVWAVDLTDDDTNATNKIFRVNMGTSSLRGMLATGEGIYIADDSNPQNKKIRLIKNNDLNDKVLPRSVSDQLDLNSYEFDECVFHEFDEFIVVACKSEGSAFNDTLLVLNTVWNLWDTGDGQVHDFTERDGILLGASAVNQNVYTIYDGLDDDDGLVEGDYISGDDTLDTEELKKCKRIAFEGEIDDQQSFEVQVSLDGDDFVSIGTMTGDGPYVDRSAGTEYGVGGYGVTLYGSDETRTKFPYMVAFKLRLQNSFGKFYRIRFRILTLGFGFFSFRTVRWDDIRKKRLRIPQKFRGET